ncbi:uncharacterized protein LOC110467220 [Mizuhopecten yessoensis]|nr:uncharacterized protein LOC110467220 [Mizuhopecten yessoensis]
MLCEAWKMAADVFEDCRGHVQNPYQLLAQKTHGKVGRYTVSTCLYIGLVGSSVALIVVNADNMETLSNAFGYEIYSCYWMLIITGCITPLTWFGTPKDFWWMAYGAVSTTALCVVMIVIMCVLDAPNQPNVQHTDTDIQKITLGIGMIMYGFGIHSNLPTFQMDMKRPMDYKLAVISGYIITLFMFLPTMLSGFLVYGKNLDDNILTSLPHGALYYTVVAVITLHLTLALIIFVNPILQDVELLLHIPTEFTWKRCVCRSVIAACLLFLSATIPKFNSIQSLVGGLSFSMLGYIFPVLCYKKMCQIYAAFNSQMTNTDSLKMISWKEHKRVIPLWKAMLNYGILGLGVLAGFVTSLSAIISILSPDSFSLPCYINIG